MAYRRNTGSTASGESTGRRRNGHSAIQALARLNLLAPVPHRGFCGIARRKAVQEQFGGANKTAAGSRVFQGEKFLKGLVVCAVPCEPVSTEYFPVIREFNREVHGF
jgi:hypothetical protein